LKAVFIAELEIEPGLQVADGVINLSISQTAGT